MLEICVNTFERVCNMTEHREEVLVLRESLVIISFRSLVKFFLMFYFTHL